jgi:hypothetical protein
MMVEPLFIHNITQLKFLFYPFQQAGDKLYKNDEAEEVIDDTVLDDAIEDINVT